jgi:hypothetical protein
LHSGLIRCSSSVLVSWLLRCLPSFHVRFHVTEAAHSCMFACCHIAELLIS